MGIKFYWVILLMYIFAVNYIVILKSIFRGDPSYRLINISRRKRLQKEPSSILSFYGRKHWTLKHFAKQLRKNWDLHQRDISVAITLSIITSFQNKIFLWNNCLHFICFNFSITRLNHIQGNMRLLVWVKS